MPQQASTANVSVPAQKSMARAAVCLWGLWFLICFGLGYPTLNRYNARTVLPDAAIYAKLATEGPASVEGPLRFRVLVPFVARPVYRLAKLGLGSWDPLAFAFLVVNAFFVASTASQLSAVGGRLLPNRSTALLASTLYLLNFAVANDQLAGLVDAGEACFLMAVVACMSYERWAMLPLFGILGALTKESFVPFSIVMAATWWIAAGKRAASRRVAGWLFATVVVEIVSIMVLHHALSDHNAGLWDFALSLNSHTSCAANLIHSLADRSSWFVLIWLLPLGLIRIRQFPREWVWAVAMGSVTALVLNAYHSTVGGGGGGVGRYVFNIAGPLLSLSVATLLGESRVPQTRPEPN